MIAPATHFLLVLLVASPNGGKYPPMDATSKAECISVGEAFKHRFPQVRGYFCVPKKEVKQ